jgi:hypothetical protein
VKSEVCKKLRGRFFETAPFFLGAILAIAGRIFQVVPVKKERIIGKEQ